jgi:hypothetical protein
MPRGRVSTGLGVIVAALLRAFFGCAARIGSVASEPQASASAIPPPSRGGRGSVGPGSRKVCVSASKSRAYRRGGARGEDGRETRSARCRLSGGPARLVPGRARRFRRACGPRT